MPKHEELNNQPEANENGFTEMAKQVPDFEEHMKQYEAEHPDVVSDIDKARAMAEAGNEIRNEAALRNELEEAFQNGDSEKENEIINRLADLGVKDMMDSLKDYPDGTAFQRTQKSFLSALDKTRIGRKLNYMAARHNVREEVKKWDQSEWAQSLLADVENIEETAGQDYDFEVKQQEAEREAEAQDFQRGQQRDIRQLREEADLRQQLEESIQNGDSEQERKILNRIADFKVDTILDDLEEKYPRDTAFQRVQFSILTALYKTRVNKKIGHMVMLHETKKEAKGYNQSEWAQSLLEDANRIEESMQGGLDD